MLEITATTVRVNGETVAVSKKPKYMRGVPKVTSNPSLIGDTIVVTQSKDFTEAMGVVTIGLRSTLANIQLLEDWQENVGLNAVMLVDNATGFTKTFNRMSVEEDVEIDFDSDEFEVVFKGGQGV
jgi:hypothetical protein